ncbi:MAG: hypothetical protein ABEI52_00080, partial [Halobacteriaceae archaeon]
MAKLVEVGAGETYCPYCETGHSDVIQHENPIEAGFDPFTCLQTWNTWTVSLGDTVPGPQERG